MKIGTLLVGLFSAVFFGSGILFAQMQLEYSTYLGGSADDKATGIAIDSSGSLYLAGWTRSANFPLANPYQPSFGGGSYNGDAFVSCLSSTGTTLVYSTYLGGSGDDYGTGIALGSNNNIYLAGTTGSSNFPTANPYQPSRGGMYGDNAFVCQLSSLGTSLVYSTYLGGSDMGWGGTVTLDSQNRAHLSGSTFSTDFPLVNPYQGTHGGAVDSFVSTLSSTGTSLVYSTYLGGSNNDWGRGIALDSANQTYLSGYTSSTDFPLHNPYQSAFSGQTANVFVSALSSSGTSLVYSTYLGGGEDYGNSVSLDSRGRAYVTGTTYSTDFPTANPYQASSGGGPNDAFISSLSSDGSSLVYSTYLGGSGEDEGSRITIDSAGRAHLTGYTTSSTGFPLMNPYQSTYGGGDRDAFISSLSSTGTSLVYSTYLGGSRYDSANNITIDSSYRPWIAGYTDSTDFPTANPYQATWSEGTNGSGDPTKDIFISRLSSLAPTRRYVFDSGDYNGDGTSDIGIFREAAGLWAIRGITRLYFGGSSDQTVPGDYNGNGTADIGIFREATGLWAIRGVTRLYFGGSGDQAVPGDFDGNSQGEPGIARETSGLWAIRGVTRVYFGTSGDTFVPFDYNGDGTTDLGVYRSGSGLWATREVTRLYFGSSGDTPVPGDYSGDGTGSEAIFRETTGLWAIRGITRLYFGSSTDDPVPSDYSGSGTTNIGVFREAAGLWALRGVTRAYFGTSGDIPATR